MKNKCKISIITPNPKFNSKTHIKPSKNNPLENSKQENLKEGIKVKKRSRDKKNKTDINKKTKKGINTNENSHVAKKEENKEKKKNDFIHKSSKEVKVMENHYNLRSRGKEDQKSSNKNIRQLNNKHKNNNNNNINNNINNNKMNNNMMNNNNFINNFNKNICMNNINNNNNFMNFNNNNNFINNINNNNFMNNININNNFMNFNNNNININNNMMNNYNLRNNFNNNNMMNNFYNNRNDKIFSPPRNISKNKGKKNDGNNQNKIEKINDNSSYFNKITSPPLICIINNGKTSYMNMSLQCFANIRNISGYILNKRNIIEMNSSKMPVTNQFSIILLNLFPLEKNNNNDSYPLKDFHSCIIKLNPIFKGRTTKNVTDFVVFFIDKLDEETKILVNNNTKINSILKETNFQSIKSYLKYLIDHNEDTIIFKTFSWINKKYEKCWECGKDNLKFQKYFTYDLNIENAISKTIMQSKDKITVHDCVKYSSEKQTLYNVYCNQCNKKTNIDLTSTICITQNLLVFLFRGLEKKENIDDMKNNKIRIQIEQNIDLSDLIEDKKNSFSKYTLHGIILYDTEKKEYFAYCVSPINAKWYEYKGEQIRDTDFNIFIDQINNYNYTKLPVILFYRHFDNNKIN